MQLKKSIENIVFSYDWLDIILELTNEQAGYLLKMVYAYIPIFKDPAFEDAKLQMAFKFIKAHQRSFNEEIG